MTVNAGAQIPSFSNNNNAGVPLRIMPVGASQVAGTGSTDGNGWRQNLYNLLTYDGKSVSYAGTQNFGKLVWPLNLVEAYPGLTIIEVLGKLLNDNVLSQQKPNVIIATIGSNNCVKRSKSPYDDGVSQMSQVLDQIRDQLPDTLTLVAGVTRWLKDNQNDPCIQKVNAGIQQAVANHQAYGQKVQFVDLYDVLDPGADYIGDGLHPNDGGYKKLAKTWFEAILAWQGEISAPR
jgi:lysophospholipase L1-like esterase